MRTKKVATLGLLLAVALILGYVESIIPMPFYMPGMKLGLGNLAILFALYKIDYRSATVLMIMKVLISGFIFGNGTSILYSLAGGVLSFLIMLLLKKVGCFSYTGVSMGGGVAHNIGQIVVAAFMLSPDLLLYYMPVLMITGLITGFVLGVVTKLVCEYSKIEII